MFKNILVKKVTDFAKSFLKKMVHQLLHHIILEKDLKTDVEDAIDFSRESKIQVNRSDYPLLIANEGHQSNGGLFA